MLTTVYYGVGYRIRGGIPEVPSLRILRWIVAEHRPSRADVFGNDLSPIQPIWVPTNVKFVVDDAEDDWNYTPEERFHFIHGRGLGGCIADWPRLLGRILDDLHPGGVCEMHEFGWIETVAGETLGESLQMWIELVSKGFLKLGKTLDIGLALEELMENAGFINVKVKRVKVSQLTRVLIPWCLTESPFRSPSALGPKTTRKSGFASCSKFSTAWIHSPPLPLLGF